MKVQWIVFFCILGKKDGPFWGGTKPDFENIVQSKTAVCDAILVNLVRKATMLSFLQNYLPLRETFTLCGI